MSKKSSLSTTLLLSFCFVLTIVALLAEFFQNPIKANLEIDQYYMLFNQEDIAPLKKLSLTNNLGTFSLKKNHLDYDENTWEMSSPRQLKVQEQAITGIINVLEKIKIRGVLERDSINTTNFNFDSPYLRFDYELANGKKDSLIIGMINPIDESAYAIIESKDAIYHIDALAGHLEKLDLSDFIESRAFTFKNDAVHEINLYRGPPIDSNKILSFKRHDNGWTDQDGQGIIEEKIDDFIGQIKNIKSLLILDKQTDKLKEIIKQSEEVPYYFLSFLMNDNTYLEYSFSKPITQLPDIRMEKRQSVIIKKPDDEFATLVAQEMIHFLSDINIRNFRKLAIKKLFY